MTWRLDRVAELLTSGILVTLVLLNGVEVVSRSVFNYSLFWAFEIYLLLGNWMYFIGVTLVYNRAEDITLSYFFDRLGPRWRRRGLLAINLVAATVLLVLAYYGVKLIALQSQTRTTGLGIPNHYYSLPILVGALIMILSIVRQWMACFLGMEEGDGEPP